MSSRYWKALQTNTFFPIDGSESYEDVPNLLKDGLRTREMSTEGTSQYLSPLGGGQMIMIVSQ